MKGLSFLHIIELKNFKIMMKLLKYCFMHPLISTINQILQKLLVLPTQSARLSACDSQ